MADMRRFTIRHSVVDVIRILENEPVMRDGMPELTIVELMNRASLAHLSIERALKFLITDAGGPLEPEHDLGDRYLQLKQHDTGSAQFLEKAFCSAVQHFRYNPNASNLTHLKTLEIYLRTTGSNAAFQGIRYWELTQSLSGVLPYQVHLTLHLELLYALSEILLAPNRSMEMADNRVERKVHDAMFDTVALGYSPETPKEKSVHAYIKWAMSFGSTREALANAVKQGFKTGDDFMEAMTRKAHSTLLASKDVAVRYFANALDILPPQSRNLIPCVEWSGQTRNSSGIVKSPAGTILGGIERGLDGIWYISSLAGEAGAVYAKASSQTDARCYLARVLTRRAVLTVEKVEKTLTVVNHGYYFFQTNHNAYDWERGATKEDATWTHKITFWENGHGIKNGKDIRIEVSREDEHNIVDILEGQATDVSENEVNIVGSHVMGLDGRVTIRKR